jgi:hypothetical protein
MNNQKLAMSQVIAETSKAVRSGRIEARRAVEVAATKSVPEPPTWHVDAFTFVARIQSGVRIRALRLTERQAGELKAYTGRDDLLLGYPVALR